MSTCAICSRPSRSASSGASSTGSRVRSSPTSTSPGARGRSASGPWRSRRRATRPRRPGTYCAEPRRSRVALRQPIGLVPPMRLRNLLILLALLAPLILAPASPSATVAGTNGKIAYSDGTNIWLMNSDGTGASQLTSAAGANVDPALSPDGTQVAFGSSRFGGWDIMVANVDGSGTFRLTSNAVTWERRPAWSPDGNAIVHQSVDVTSLQH